MAICVVGIAFMALQGCSQFNLDKNGETGAISMAIDGVDATFFSDGAFLKSDVDSDTNNFILTIYSEDGHLVYDGLYGARPEVINVTPGTYDISIYSLRFNPPMFDAPQYGDRQQISVESGESTRVSFTCRQMNSGLKIRFTNEFIAKFPGNGVYVSQGENRVAYDYSQTKYIYLSQDNFALSYNRNGEDTVLLNKTLQSGQMVTMTLSYSNSSTSYSVSGIQIDTTRDWISFDYNVALNIPAGVLTIPEAVLVVGEKVKVFGYILGGDPSSSSIRVGPPFESKSSLVIATSMTERSRENMMVVELPSGAVRDALNLVNNPHLLGNPIILTGTITESYYGYPGIKNTKGYSLM